jgi:hypothetical protein
MKSERKEIQLLRQYDLNTDTKASQSDQLAKVIQGIDNLKN